MGKLPVQRNAWVFTPNELVSIVSTNIGDPGMVLVNREDHLQYINDVAHELWLKSKAAHVIREYPLDPTTSWVELPHDDIISFVMLQIRYKAAPENTPPVDNEQPMMKQNVIFAPQQEKPPLQNIEDGQGAYQNIGNTTIRQHLTPEFRNGRYRIHSVRNFPAGAVLTAHCVIHTAEFQWLVKAQTDPTVEENVDYEDEERIWEPLRNLFIEGCTWRAARTHYSYTKHHTSLSLSKDAEGRYYGRLLPEAVHYIHSLKDSTSVLHVKPFQYLNE